MDRPQDRPNRTRLPSTRLHPGSCPPRVGISGDCPEEKNNALLTLALYFFL